MSMKFSSIHVSDVYDDKLSIGWAGWRHSRTKEVALSFELASLVGVINEELHRKDYFYLGTHFPSAIAGNRWKSKA